MQPPCRKATLPHNKNKYITLSKMQRKVSPVKTSIILRATLKFSTCKTRYLISQHKDEFLQTNTYTNLDTKSATMAMEKDLEKAGGAVVSKEAQCKSDEIHSIPNTDETIQEKGNHAHHGDLGIQSVPKETPPGTPKNPKKHQIDRSVADIVHAMKWDGIDPTDSERDPWTTAQVVEGVYERNLHICAIVLMKDYIRTREYPSSIERQQVFQASVRKHGECSTFTSPHVL
jgi:hypothetical protein